jgi:hypothetical protein
VTSEEMNRLRQRMASLSDGELLRIINVEYKDYRPEAIEYAKTELDSRGIVYGRAKPAAQRVDRGAPGEDDIQNEEDGADELDQDDLSEFKPSFCIICGAEMRSGYLFAGRGEMTVVFSDNNEERFVELNACPKCGHVRLTVDFETDVAD